jgi:hypothetical protein
MGFERRTDYSMATKIVDSDNARTIYKCTPVHPLCTPASLLRTHDILNIDQQDLAELCMRTQSRILEHPRETNFQRQPLTFAQ